LLSFLGSKEDDITKSSQETAAVSDSGSVLRQEVNGWRRENVENLQEDGPRKDDIAKSPSITESPGKDGQKTTGRELQEVLLSPAGKSSNLRYYLKRIQKNHSRNCGSTSRIVFFLFSF
jgi:hypothetical protein